MVIQLTLSPEEAYKSSIYTRIAIQRSGVSDDEIKNIRIVKRSIDARGRNIKVNLTLELELMSDKEQEQPSYSWGDVSGKREVIIIGSGPGGLFAALRLIELGLKPIVLERGKDVSSRKFDIAAINRGSEINTESNYCFGEGGAGTYSDGKLFTRSKKRGNSRRILEIFNIHGANENILYESHPHIGTEKLPRVIAAMRETILASGGEIRFESKVVDFSLAGDKVTDVILESGERVTGEAVILATGHSARDIYEMLHRNNIEMEAKSFAMGVRIEHPQRVIDYIQYGMPDRGPYLPAAAYTLTTQAAGRGVYSFCMCPGGFIVPASTAPEECVVNGMSPSGRNSKFANSGMVTEIRESDYKHLTAEFGVLAGMEFQRQFEHAAYCAGGAEQVAPAQRLNDFISGKLSKSTAATSYHPGVTPTNMHDWMPPFISNALREGLAQFGKKMQGYLSSEAQLIGVESRTSSPLRIPRSPENLAHPQYSNLYPCGEGAGYAGGIVSAGVDGERIADKIAELILGAE